MPSGLWKGGEVGSEGALGLSGNEPFEADSRFFLGLAVGEATCEVGAYSVAVAESDDDDDV